MKYSNFFSFFALIGLFISSCTTSSDKRSEAGYTKYYPKYAKGFSINLFPDYREIVVYLHAEDKSDSIITRVPDSIARVACFSSTHLAAIDLLGKASLVKAFSSKKYMYAPQRYTQELIEIGEPHDIQYEKLLAAKPDITVLFGIDQSIQETVKQLEAEGIVSIVNLEYREAHPLAQAEWIKFFGALLHEDKKADSIFKAIERRYIALKNQPAPTSRPKVMLNLPWRGSWYVSGNNTLIAQYIEDAGGNYAFKDQPIRGNLPMSIEKVYEICKNSDIWLNPGEIKNQSDMMRALPECIQFDPFKKNQIYNNNLKINSLGCNDYFESATMRPDLVLQDLKKIFQQDTHNLYYYRKIY